MYKVSILELIISIRLELGLCYVKRWSVLASNKNNVSANNLLKQN